METRNIDFRLKQF